MDVGDRSQSGRWIELYTHLCCIPKNLQFGSTWSTQNTKEQFIALVVILFTMVRQMSPLPRNNLVSGFITKK